MSMVPERCLRCGRTWGGAAAGGACPACGGPLVQMIPQHALGALPELSPGAMLALRVVSMASAGASAYHGYKRNRGSVGWAIGWGVLGAIFPIITPAVALAQGFGKPAKRGR